MAKCDFNVFDRTVGEILGDLDDADRDALKHRINFEIEQYEAQAGSVVHHEFIATRKRIREIERKALARMGERVSEPTEQGKQCTLCARYESDVRLVTLGEAHAVCAECIVLVKEIVDEDGDCQRSNK
jgi:hypothetical protein